MQHTQTARVNGVTALERRHFAFIASIIKSLPDNTTIVRAHRGSIAKAFAEAFQASNPRFDRAKFLNACGTEE